LSDECSHPTVINGRDIKNVIRLITVFIGKTEIIDEAVIDRALSVFKCDIDSSEIDGNIVASSVV
jgi:hypothetical protein